MKKLLLILTTISTIAIAGSYIPPFFKGFDKDPQECYTTESNPNVFNYFYGNERANIIPVESKEYYCLVRDTINKRCKTYNRVLFYTFGLSNDKFYNPNITNYPFTCPENNSWISFTSRLCENDNLIHQPLRLLLQYSNDMINWDTIEIIKNDYRYQGIEQVFNNQKGYLRTLIEDTGSYINVTYDDYSFNESIWQQAQYDHTLQINSWLNITHHKENNCTVQF